MGHANLAMADYLFKVHFEPFSHKRLDTIDKTFFFILYNHFLLNNKQKKIRHAHFPPNCLYFKKASIESDQCHVPVQKVKELTFYQLLPYLAICVDFG